MSQVEDWSSDFGSSDHRTSDEQFEYLGLAPANNYASQTQYVNLRNACIATENSKLYQASTQTYTVTEKIE